MLGTMTKSSLRSVGYEIANDIKGSPLYSTNKTSAKQSPSSCDMATQIKQTKVSIYPQFISYFNNLTLRNLA